jgi:hypothetical protein
MYIKSFYLIFYRLNIFGSLSNVHKKQSCPQFRFYWSEFPCLIYIHIIKQLVLNYDCQSELGNSSENEPN